MRDNFDNILKRNVIGEFSNEYVIKRENRNRKRNNMVYRDKSNVGEDIYIEGENLKVFN